MLKALLDRWRLCALLASAAMLAIAHAFQTFGDLAPCPLCLRQREVYWTALGLSAAFMVLVRLSGGARWREATCWVLALVFLGGAGLAAFHAGVEWKFWPGPSTCLGSGGTVTAADMQELLRGAAVETPSCDKAPWVFAGLSMAGWNAVASLILAGLSVLAALRERSKP